VSAAIQAHGTLKKEDHEFKVSLSYIAKLCLKNKPVNITKQITDR
jgi:hypothetical protein